MKRTHSRGSLLMIVLMLLSVMGILAVTYLLIGTEDYSVASRQEWNARTFFLGRSGLEYYEANQSALPAGTKTRISIDTESGTDYCDLEVSDTEVIATGIITRGQGEIAASRTLKASSLDTGSWYEVGK